MYDYSVILNGTVYNGTNESAPPYNFTWASDKDGIIGTYIYTTTAASGTTPTANDLRLNTTDTTVTDPQPFKNRTCSFNHSQLKHFITFSVSGSNLKFYGFMVLILNIH
jgi:hypothetical protein